MQRKNELRYLRLMLILIIILLVLMVLIILENKVCIKVIHGYENNYKASNHNIEEWYNNYEYILNDKNRTIKLTKYNGNSNTILLPNNAVINGKNYTTIISRGVFSDNTNITSVSIEEGVVADKSIDILFSGCTNLITVDLKGLDTSNVTNIGFMFNLCKNLETVNLDGWDTSNVTTMQCMFQGCNKISYIDLHNFDTRKVTCMGGMFYLCYNLKQLDVSNFITEKVTDMADMFNNCQNLENIDVSNFDTKNVENMHGMFGNCFKIKSLNLSNFNTAKVKDISSLAYKCEILQEIDLSSFNTNNINNMDKAFEECDKLKIIKLGEKWSFKENTGLQGYWRKTDEQKKFSAQELIQLYDGNSMKGTYIRIDLAEVKDNEDNVEKNNELEHYNEIDQTLSTESLPKTGLKIYFSAIIGLSFLIILILYKKYHYYKLIK